MRDRNFSRHIVRHERGPSAHIPQESCQVAEEKLSGIIAQRLKLEQ
jgi:hypothetical protein